MISGDAPLHPALAGWGNFYLITGTAAAALTGLQFVVQTLIGSEIHHVTADDDDPEGGIAAFGSPTVVHFSLALVLSGVLSVPWPRYGALRIILGALGVGALGYAAVVLRRALRQRTYVPVFEDWLWHLVFPIVAYAALVGAAALPARDKVWAFFAVAAVTLCLLCVGIHNAWDSVVHLTLKAARTAPAGAEGPTRHSDDGPTASGSGP